VKPLSADWLYTGTGISRHAGIEVDDAGRIVRLTEGKSGRHFAGAVLLPGLVNTHTHLELTGFEGQNEESDFPTWIRRIIELKAGRSEEDFYRASLDGLRAGYATGVTTVADTGSSAGPLRALAELGGSGIAYLEVFGPDPGVAAANIAAFQARLRELAPFESGRVRLGVSPHAPYSVSGPLYRAAAKLARSQSRPIAVHVAESQAESDLLAGGKGAFADMWRSRGIPCPEPPGCSPVGWLDANEVLGPDTLCIHVIRPGPDDITRLKRHDCSIAHCPRSNLRHGHGSAPLAEFLAAGLRVGVGTDSAASVSPPDLLAEARAAMALANLTAEQALGLATIEGARALGLEGEIGTLEPGKWADAVVIRVPEATRSQNLARALLDSGPMDVLATFVAGRPVFSQ
jgi:5-methylthioadenosine/S-adenosylhomocysteine deaminase